MYNCGEKLTCSKLRASKTTLVLIIDCKFTVKVKFCKSLLLLYRNCVLNVRTIFFLARGTFSGQYNSSRSYVSAGLSRVQ